MSIVKPFKAVRPKKEFAEKVAALPYDVMNSDEAREMVKGNAYSFLHVDKAEVDLDPSVNIYDEKVYLKARENLDKMISTGVLKQDNDEYYYLYRQIMDGRAQTGIVACASIDDYINGDIKKHEFTRADKEEDRIRHVDCLDANTGPIFLTYRKNNALGSIVEKWTKTEPVYDFTADDDVRHTVWIIDDKNEIDNITAAFGGIDALYIADGHHRCASAVKVGLKRREAKPDFTGREEFNFFLSVIFSSDELAILDYNRLVKDLNGLGEKELLDKVSVDFDLESCASKEPYKPEAAHVFGMYLGEKWYKLTAKEGSFDNNDPVGRLDVTILQKNLLEPVLGIGDPRTDKRIDFAGGIRGLKELERRADTDMKLAFSMYPTTLDDLMEIADAGMTMPPKSTWFEPKLRSGLFIHQLA